jgi:ubiquinone/menaquinone biosynthesis C-methylase UbiE
MAEMTNPEYLRTQQYRDASNLNARIRLHTRFSTNSYGWYRWLFDRLQFPPPARVLELGCGPANLWQHNAYRLHAGWTVTLTDFSPGMVAEAVGNLSDNPQFRFAVVDAQHISFAGKTFDAVIANHMLPHVPDRERALAEMQRVLKPGGCFYASTVGESHLWELEEMATRLAPGRAGPSKPSLFASFSLENGAAQIARYFRDVTMHRYEDALDVTEVAPLADYLLSGGFDLDASRRDELTAFLEREIARQGRIHITKDTGLFVARL